MKSYMILTPTTSLCSASSMQREVKERIKESDLDGVLMIRAKAVRTETEEAVTGGFNLFPGGIYLDMCNHTVIAYSGSKRSSES